MSRNDDLVETSDLDRREALKKAIGIGAAAGVAFAAPTINGLSVVPGYAAAASNPPEPIVVNGGPADKTLGCYSGALGDDRFYTALGTDGYFGFMFQGCSLGNTESVALDVLNTPVGDAYKAPTGYRCRFEIISGGSSVYNSGYLNDPINGIADTGGVIFVSPAQFPNGLGTVNWRITCDPL